MTIATDKSTNVASAMMVRPALATRAAQDVRSSAQTTSAQELVGRGTKVALRADGRGYAVGKWLL